jgi:hypothetical protein
LPGSSGVSPILGSRLGSRLWNPATPFESGQVQIVLGARENFAPRTFLPSGSTGPRLRGLPVIGFQAVRYINGNVLPGVLAIGYKKSADYANMVNSTRMAIRDSGDSQWSLVDAWPGQTFEQPMWVEFDPHNAQRFYLLARPGRLYRGGGCTWGGPGPSHQQRGSQPRAHPGANQDWGTGRDAERHRIRSRRPVRITDGEEVGAPVIGEGVSVVAGLADEDVGALGAGDMVDAFRADQRIRATGANPQRRESRAGHEQRHHVRDQERARAPA